MKNGRVYWLTGLSGAGKSTLGSLLYEHLRSRKDSVVYLDGDILREVFGGLHGHTIDERRLLAMSYARMCRILSLQGIDVVCATISMFHSVRRWNRENIPAYFEVYLNVPIEVLIQRDQKQLYSRALRGEVSDVMGVNVDIEAPESPDVVLVNDGSHGPEELLYQLLSSIEEVLVEKAR